MLDLSRGIDLLVTVENKSMMAACEVIQVYGKELDSGLAPLKPRLCAFERVKLAPAQEKQITVHVEADAFLVVNEEGKKQKDGKMIQISVGFGQPDNRTKELTGKECCTFVIERLDQ